MHLLRQLAAIVFASLAMAISVAGAAQPLARHHPIALLDALRPIGAAGNNLVHPAFDPVPGSPELALAPLNFIIARQFRALREGDRFYWLNQAFDRATARTIAGATLSKIILRNTDTSSLPDHAFIAATLPPRAGTGRQGRVIETHGQPAPGTDR